MSEIWQETAWHYAQGMEYYRGLLEEVAKYLGPSVYVSEDGSVQDDPILAKIPDIVRGSYIGFHQILEENKRLRKQLDDYSTD